MPSGSRTRSAPNPLLLAAALVLLPAPAATQPAGAPADSARLFGRSDLALLAGLVGAQAIFLALDDEVRDRVQAMRDETTDDVAAVVQPLGRAFPWYAASAGTFVVGRIAGRQRVADVGLHVFASLLLSETVTGSLKGLSGRWRPRTTFFDGADTVALFHDSEEWRFLGGWKNDHRRSYPSGHATAAFTIAAALSEEFAGATPWVAYPIATAVAWSRLNDDVHWASDVTMGALVGIVSARAVVRYGHRRGGPLERWLLLDADPRASAVRLGLRLPLPYRSPGTGVALVRCSR